jgi:hypothetical protein
MAENLSQIYHRDNGGVTVLFPNKFQEAIETAIDEGTRHTDEAIFLDGAALQLALMLSAPDDGEVELLTDRLTALNDSEGRGSVLSQEEARLLPAAQTVVALIFKASVGEADWNRMVNSRIGRIGKRR